MKPGDKVKALVQIGLMRKPRWLEATLVERNTVEIHGNRLHLEPGKIKGWKPLENFQESIDEFAGKNWAELKEIVSAAAKHFLPGDEVKFDEIEKGIEIDGVSVLPSVTEVGTIAEFREIPCWSVAYYVTTYSRNEPPDSDEVVCGNATTADHAARILIDTVLKNRADAYWENLWESRYAESLKD